MVSMAVLYTVPLRGYCTLFPVRHPGRVRMDEQRRGSVSDMTKGTVARHWGTPLQRAQQQGSLSHASTDHSESAGDARTSCPGIHESYCIQ